VQDPGAGSRTGSVVVLTDRCANRTDAVLFQAPNLTL